MTEKVYDFVIIGSGLGGLQCAYILADFGYSVCVLEKNQQLGGSLQVFSRDKTVFDTGVHYLPALDEGQPLHSYFKYFGLTKSVKWKKMDTDFDQISFYDGQKFYHSSGWNNFVDTLIGNFPEEAEGIAEYARLVQYAVSTFPLDNLEYNERDHTDDDILELSAKNVIDKVTSNERLRAVLAGSNLLYAGRAENCPFYVHALVTHGYVLSAYKCINGGSQIAKELAKKIRAKGGAIFKRKQVESFDLENGTIVSAKTTDGDTFRGKTFISNIQPKVLFQLVGKDNLQPSYYNRFQRATNTLSSFTVHIACKPNSFPYLNHNVYHHTTTDVWAKPDYKQEEWPLQYMLSTPAVSNNDEFADAISIMTYMRYDEVEKWKDSQNTIVNQNKREASYEAFKQEKIEQVLLEVEKRFPNIIESIKSVYASTPLTFRDYLGTDDGNMYGTEKDFRRGIANFVSPRTKIPNLWLTGQYLNLHGILGVTISSIVTCSQFLNKQELLEKIKQS